MTNKRSYTGHKRAVTDIAYITQKQQMASFDGALHVWDWKELSSDAHSSLSRYGAQRPACAYRVTTQVR